ncbi:MAG: signal peptidase I [Chloroflexi bacterium]|nr:signal peptidase I [Chloroflexota bacterium]
MKSAVKQFIMMLALALGVFLLLQNTVHSSIVVGSSMEPSFHNEQRLLMNQIAYNFSEPQRGDVIIFRPPYNDKATPLIKRIIGLPGETVEIKSGRVYIQKNGKSAQLDEPYIKDSPNYSYRVTVPQGEYFVLGDNRNSSNDSHTGWTVPRKNFIGKVWLSIWPPGKWGAVPTYELPE